MNTTPHDREGTNLTILSSAYKYLNEDGADREGTNLTILSSVDTMTKSQFIDREGTNLTILSSEIITRQMLPAIEKGQI